MIFFWTDYPVGCNVIRFLPAPGFLGRTFSWFLFKMGVMAKRASCETRPRLGCCYKTFKDWKEALSDSWAENVMIQSFLDIMNITERRG